RKHGCHDPKERFKGAYSDSRLKKPTVDAAEPFGHERDSDSQGDTGSEPEDYYENLEDQKNI
ncbi:MAG: hypothetical protein M1815_003125, partial [Lichina confinis]